MLPLALIDVADSRCTAGAPDCLAPRANCPVIYSRRGQGKTPRAKSSTERAPDCPVISAGPSGVAQSAPFSLFLCLFSSDSFGLFLVESLALRQECLAYKTIDKVSRSYLYSLFASL
jgi:hypothetical protein